MSEKKKRGKEFDNPYSVAKAITKGNVLTKLSMVVLGLGNIAHHQIIKGLGMLAIEIAFIAFMVMKGAGYIVDLVHLGGQEQQKVWSEAKQIYEYTKGDNSLLMLLFGVATCFLVAAFIIFWRGSVKSAYKMQCLSEAGKKIPTFKEDIKSLFDKDLHRTLLTLPILGILIFTVLPLVFMICMAFTNYSKVDAHTTIFNWVGLANFEKVLNIGDSIGSTFWSVLGWTLIWAVAATFSNYILGMILAIVINRKGTRCKAFWRFCFVLSAAVPQFVSLLLMRTIFSQNGIVNTLLLNAGIIEKAIPFWSNTMLARVMVVVINIWVGIPFTMLQVTGVLQNIPADLYEAATVDGAGPVRTFFSITLPYMLFVTGPYLENQQELVHRMIDDGHIVGNQTVNHPNLPKQSVETAQKELSDLNKMCEEMYGVSMKYMRPPEGEYSERVLAVAKDMGYRTILWSFAYKDWDINMQQGADYAFNQVTPYLHDGAILLLHAVSSDNANALEDIINYAKNEGYTFESLDELQ